MTKTFNISEKERLSFSLLLSFVLHLVLVVAILLILFFYNTNLAFKKGTGTNPNKIKISGFIPTQENIMQQAQPKPQSPQAAISTQSNNSNEKQSRVNQQNLKDSQKQTNTQKNQNEIDLKNLTLNDSSQAPNQSLQGNKTYSQSLAAIFAQYPKLDNITKRDVSDLYGEEFGDYGLVEQDFIINNLRDIGRITAKYLKYPRDAVRLGQQGVNIVQFYLHPNGDISDLKIIKPSGYVILDRNSERTIEIAYKDYPRPVSRVLIRIRVSMELFYY